MANNITVKDASAANVVVKTTDNASVHTPHHNVDYIASGSVQVTSLPAGNSNIGRVTVDNLLTGSVNIASLPNEGQQSMANSISVAIASDQTAIPVSDGGSSLTVDGFITGNVTILNTVSIQDGGNIITVDGTVSVQNLSGTVNIGNTPNVVVTSMPSTPLNISGSVSVNNVVAVSDNNGSLTVDGTVNVANLLTGSVTLSTAIPAGDNNIGNVDIVSLPNEGQQTMANSISVAFASDQTPIQISGTVNIGGVVPVSDNNGSLTVDGFVTTTGNVNVLNSVTVTDGGSSLTVDGNLFVTGNVNILNTVNISDAAGSITVDGFVTATGNVNVLNTVTIQDGGSAVSIDDNNGSITVDAPTGTPLNVTLLDASGESVMDGANNAVRVNIVAGAGSGGTAMTDNSAFTTGSTSFTPAGGTYKSNRDTLANDTAGAFAITNRRALLAALETPTGDSAMDDTNDALRVNVVAGSSGGVSHTDDSAFTTGSSAFVPVGGTFKLTRDAVDNNDAGAFAMTQNRALLAAIETASGTSAMDESNAALRVNVVAGSGGGVTHTDDATFTPATDDGVPAFGFYNDSTPDSVNEGDAGALRMSARRELYTQIRDAAGNERGVNVDANNRLQVNVQSPVIITGGVSLISSLPAGTNYLGSVQITGTVLISDGSGSLTVDGTVSVNALPAGTNSIGIVGVTGTVNVGNTVTVNGSVSVPNLSGTVNIGNSPTVVINSLPALAAGTNSIGVVGVTGTVNIGNTVTVAGSVSVPNLSGTVNIGNTPNVNVSTLPALSAGTNSIGVVGVTGTVSIGNTPTVNVGTLPALSAGANSIGVVGVTGSVSISNTVTISAPNFSGTVNIGNTPSVTVSSLPNEGQQTMANSISVAIASDQTPLNIGNLLTGSVAISGPVTIQDGGNIITVDGTVNVSSIASVGNLLTGNVILRDSTGDSVMDDANDAVRVNIVAGAGSGGTAMTDDAAFSVGSTSFTPAGGTYRSTRDTVDDNDGGAFAMNSRRGLYVSPETPNGDSLSDDTNDALRVNIITGTISVGNTVTVTLNNAIPVGPNSIGIVGVTGTVSIGNTPTVNVGTLPALSAGTNSIGTVGVTGTVTINGTVSVQNLSGTVNIGNTPNVAVTSISAGDNNIGNVDVVTLPALSAGANSIGVVGVTGTVSVSSITSALPAGPNSLGVVGVTGTITVSSITSALPAGTNVIGQVIGAAYASGTGAQHIQGSAAVGTSPVGNPVCIGGLGITGRPTAVTSGTVSREWFDVMGRPVVQVGSSEFAYVNAEYTSTTNTGTIISAPGSNLYIMIYDIIVSTAAACSVTLGDGTGATRLFGRLSLAANGGWSFNSSKGVRLTANSALTITHNAGAGPLSITVNYSILPLT